MIELVTMDGEHIWVAWDKVILLAGVVAKRETGPPVPVLGATMVMLQGAPPITVRGGPAEIRDKLVRR